jgi:hypothetical protein
VIVKLDGGLGSQMTQYSLGKRVEESCELPVYYDVSWFRRDGMDLNKRHARKYELESVFPDVRVRRAGACLSKIYRTFLNTHQGAWAEYDDAILSSSAPRYLGGYYLDARYRADEAIKSHFRFNLPLSGDNREVLSRIEASPCSVAIHIRRGDFVGSGHDVTTPFYFKEAVRTIAGRTAPERASFFVFSNGMDWCRDILRDVRQEFVFVENNGNDSGAIDMYLMSRCRHFIISNSGFGYWPAFLSNRAEDKIVIMPDVSRTTFVSATDADRCGWIALPVA